MPPGPLDPDNFSSAGLRLHFHASPLRLGSSTFGPFAFRLNWRTMLETPRNAAVRGIIQIVNGKGTSMNIGEPAKHQKNLPQAPQNAPESQNEDEARRIRRLQIMMSMVSSVISQDPSLTVEEASELAAGAKRAALAMFPDKELAYDLLYKPRLQRLMRERFRLQ
jgi:hypothetical protein